MRHNFHPPSLGSCRSRLTLTEHAGFCAWDRCYPMWPLTPLTLSVGWTLWNKLDLQASGIHLWIAVRETTSETVSSIRTLRIVPCLCIFPVFFQTYESSISYWTPKLMSTSSQSNVYQFISPTEILCFLSNATDNLENGSCEMLIFLTSEVLALGPSMCIWRDYGIAKTY